MELVDRFFDFEIRNHLFDITDKRGLRPWEAVRYEVMVSVLHKPFTHVPYYDKAPANIRLLNASGRLFHFGFYLLTHRHRDSIFLLCSRDKKNGLFYDKISDRTFELAGMDNSLGLDSMNTYQQANYKYGQYVAPDISRYLSRLSRYRYDFGDIIRLVKEEFPHSSINCETLNSCYREFVSDYFYWKMVFRWSKSKRIFLVQNGIRVGMFAAANCLGVRVIEFQHGQISKNHPQYSFPDETVLPASKIYHPDYLLTFGSFWSKNRHYPGVKEVVIGNESYAESFPVPDTHGNKKLLVISNLEEGPLLAKRVKEVLARDPSFFFYFKLHPNQFLEFESYQRQFEGNDRVEVVSNQQTINQLLAQCEGIFLNDSTVELEALRVGRKVFVLTEQYYQVMDFVLGEEGVYPRKDVNEFLETYEAHKNDHLPKRNDLFSEFRENIAQEMLQV